MTSAIRHTGIVTKATDSAVTVKFAADNNDCSGCAIATVCGKGEEMEIPYPGASPSLVGRKVVLTIGSGSRALAYVLMLAVPVLLLVGITAIAMIVGASEGVAAVVAIAAVAVWEFAMYLLRDRINGANPISVSFE